MNPNLFLYKDTNEDGSDHFSAFTSYAETLRYKYIAREGAGQVREVNIGEAWHILAAADLLDKVQEFEKGFGITNKTLDRI